MLRSFICPLANGMWYLSAIPEALAFRRACRDVARVQQQRLKHILACNAETEFGRRYGFASIRSVADYQARVPLTRYDDYQGAIRQIGEGQSHILAQDPVLLLEPTSGSTAATKYIPYTPSLKAEFGRALAPWVVDLFSHHPDLLFGQAYWSVTPVTQQNQRTPGGIPIGFEEDDEYFGPLQRHLIQSVMAVPPQVKQITDIGAFRYVTLLFLLRCRRLTLISVWNPTFLTLLVEPLSNWWPQLADDIEQGTLSPPTSLPADLQTSLLALNRPNRRRAVEIRAVFQASDHPSDIYVQLWPHLSLISCWTDAHAAMHIPTLKALFPRVRLQGKGLLATEGVVSFPLVGENGSILAVRSHFYEFLPDDQPDQHPLLAHELETGKSYQVILTTGGGLYRYQLYDLVEVAGRVGNCPRLRFMGKVSVISDHFGEKLNERHVQSALTRLLEDHHLQPTFAMLACETEGLNRSAYILFIEVESAADDILLELGTALEMALQQNFHYRYCRDLGQLDRLQLFRIRDGAAETYLTTCQAQGQRAGDIKPVALHRLGGWLAVFSGDALKPSE
ncbi:MAG: GH3 auxin-responsive promoter family protein [Halieaceae bacterium]|nr:GH3 auxin-responsive promoter family protein [Halieaceae bacterium]